MKLVFEALRDGVEVPSKAYLNDAGYDVKMSEDMTLEPGNNMIPMGFKLILPPGVMAAFTPRSSFMGELVNSFVPIDPAYSGEYHLCVNNLSGKKLEVKKGERIGQLVFLPYIDVDFVDHETYVRLSRGDGGLGSTGK